VYYDALTPVRAEVTPIRDGRGMRRKLGPHETYYAAAQEEGMLLDVNVVHVEPALEPRLLNQALALVQARHPLLRVQIVEENAVLSFAERPGAPSVPLTTIAWGGEAHLDQQIEDVFSSRLDTATGPLWKVILVRDSARDRCVVLLALHHAIVDGAACMTIIDELLTACGQLEAGTDPGVSPLPLPPAVEQLLAPRGRFLRPRVFVKKIVRRLHKPPNALVPFDRPAPPRERRTRLLCRSLSREATITLRRACRAEAATVHGALCAAMMLTAYEMLRPVQENPMVVCASSVSLRRYCHPGVDRQVGCFISRLESGFRMDESVSFWPLARHISRDVHRRRERREPAERRLWRTDQKPGSHAAARRAIRDTLAEDQNHGRSSAVAVSNRGPFDLPDTYGRYRITGIYAAAGEHLLGPNIAGNFVTFHDQLFCTFAYFTPLMSCETASRFSDRVLSLLS